MFILSRINIGKLKRLTARFRSFNYIENYRVQALLPERERKTTEYRELYPGPRIIECRIKALGFPCLKFFSSS